jgi:hypothetical protein
MADGMTWPGFIDQADEASSNGAGSITFSTDNTVNSFSQLMITSEVALPVDWQDFRLVLGADKTVHLHWSVFQTEDVVHFDIERSADGQDFSFMGRVQAQSGAGDFNYKAIDAAPLRGINYYRLRQYDADGTLSFSKVRSITIDALADDFVLFPNPLPENTTLEIRTSISEEYRLLLYDQKGKVVFKADLRGDASLSDLNLPKGVYAYQILMAGGRRSGKILVR